MRQTDRQTDGRTDGRTDDTTISVEPIFLKMCSKNLQNSVKFRIFGLFGDLWG
jgi:hypothetical protein